MLEVLWKLAGKTWVRKASSDVNTNTLLPEWQLDNDGQPLQESDDSEGSEDLEKPRLKQPGTQRSKAQLISSSSGPGAKNRTFSHNATALISARMHRDRRLRNTFLVERDSDARASWRAGKPCTGN